MPFEFIRPGSHFDFVGKSRFCMTLSLGLILVSLAAIPIRGFRTGVDFSGGTEIQVRFTGEGRVDEGSIRQVVGAVGVADPSVVRFGGEDVNEFLIRFAGDAGEKGERVDLIRAALEQALGALVVDRVEFVGPRVGAELRRDGLSAMAIAFLLILIYIAFRFSTRFAPGALVAVVHDVSITAGIFILLGMEFDLRVLAALLAIIGYSLNDTIIVYDRIRENMEIRTKRNLPEVINLSVNQTLSRTILTSGTTLLAVFSLLILGGEVIRPFAFAMIIGIVVGTYSSIFIAAPVLLALENRYGEAKSA